MKSKAKKLGLWNLFLPSYYPEGAGLTNLEYGIMAEILGRNGQMASEACNCSAPDTGNMEVFAKYGSPAQKEKWLKPLLEGKIRSAFAMTEKGVASSDATNIQSSIVREGNEWVINGTKWWISGAGDPRCKIILFMGKTDPDNESPYKQQSIVLIPIETPGVTLVRPMKVFGYDDAPEGHWEIKFENVRVPLDSIVLGPGRGFEIIQGRLGPGRIHHCMRAIGIGERAMDLILQRTVDTRKKTFGRVLAQWGQPLFEIAKLRMELDQGRFLVLSAADRIDRVGAKGALKEIAMAKVVVPNVVGRILDRAVQMHGAEGVSQDIFVSRAWAGVRTLRLADGPDEVHTLQIGRNELKRAPALIETYKQYKVKSEERLKKAGLKHKL